MKKIDKNNKNFSELEKEFIFFQKESYDKMYQNLLKIIRTEFENITHESVNSYLIKDDIKEKDPIENYLMSLFYVIIDNRIKVRVYIYDSSYFINVEYVLFPNESEKLTKKTIEDNVISILDLSEFITKENEFESYFPAKDTLVEDVFISIFPENCIKYINYCIYIFNKYVKKIIKE